jgi:hypothetical protein
VALEECPGCGRVAAFAHQNIDNLPVLVDRAVEVGPAAGDLDVGFIDEPPVARGVPRRPAASMDSGVKVCTHR